MKDFLKNHGLWILFAGAVIAVALALLSYFSTNASPLVDLANTITSPFRAVCTSVSGWFTDKQNYYEDVTALKAENEALKKQIAEMEAAVRPVRKMYFSGTCWTCVSSAGTSATSRPPPSRSGVSPTGPPP